MKTLANIYLILFVTGMNIQFSYAQNFSAEEQAAIDVVEKEHKAWADRNYELWQVQWNHDENVIHIMAGKTYHHEIQGWEKLDENIGGIIKEYPEQIPENIHKNYLVWISTDLASVSCDVYGQSDSENNDELLNKKICLLKKQDGNWRMVQLISTIPASYTLKYLEWSFNNDGYSLLEEGKVEEAIKVFKLNTELYPESGNVWDSLGEGYMKAGETELAIKNYEKSLEIDPSNPNAKEMLKKLRNE